MEGVILPEMGSIWELYHDCYLGYKARSGYYEDYDTISINYNGVTFSAKAEECERIHRI